MFRKIILLLLLSAYIYDAKCEKYALIVAIDNYQSASLSSTKSAINSAKHIAQALKYNGFIKIDTLQNQYATRSAILMDLARLSVLIKPGDIVAIHFSCTSFLIKANGNKEPVIVPYDGVYLDDGNALMHNVSQSDINRSIQKIADRVGPEGNVLMTFDCDQPISTIGLANPNITILNATRDGEDSYLRGQASSRYEIRDQNDSLMGIFASSLSDILLDLPMGITNSELFDLLKNRMSLISPDQKPTVSCQNINTVFLNGHYNPGKRHILITSRIGKDQILLNAGANIGISVGAEIELHPAYIYPSDSNIIAICKVIEAKDYSSVLSCKKLTGDPVDMWAYIRSAEYGSKPISIDLSKIRASKELPQNFNTLVDSLIRKMPGVKLSNENADLYIDSVYPGLPSRLGYPVFCDLRYSANDALYKNITYSYDDMTPLINEITNFKKYLFFKGLNNYTPGYNAKLELLIRKGSISTDSISESGRTVYDGDTICIKITNTGIYPAYINLVDMSPDGRMAAFLPYTAAPTSTSYYPISKCYLRPGETHYYFENFPLSIGPPFGLETIKLFVSKDAMDLEGIINLKDNQVATRGVKVDTVFRQEGLIASQVKPEEITISSLNFEIKNSEFRPDKESNLIDFKFITDQGKEIMDGPIAKNSILFVKGPNSSQGRIYYNLLSINDKGAIEQILPNPSFSLDRCQISSSSEPYKGDYPIKTGEGKQIKYFFFYSDYPFDLSTSLAKADNKWELFSDMINSGRVPDNNNQSLKCKPIYLSITDNNDQSSMRAAKEPYIEIYSPAPKENDRGLHVSNTRLISISGFAEVLVDSFLSAPVKSVKVNGYDASYKNITKFFEIKNFPLASGENKITVEAVADNGAFADKVFTVQNLLSSAKENDKGKNYFLGIGINTYTGKCGYDSLKNAAKDVKDFANTLITQYDFDTANMKLILDNAATRSNIVTALRNYESKVNPNDNLILYFSGHGNKDQILDGGYFFIPVNIQTDESGKVDESSLISEDDIMRPFSKYSSRFTLLIMDACHSGLIAYANTPHQGSIEDKGAKWVITSGSDESVSDGIDKRSNSPFAEVLINYLKFQKPPSEIGIGKIINELKTAVPQISKQTPIGKAIEGDKDFVFKCVKPN